MKEFAHLTARSLDEAVAILKKQKGKAKLSAGGTDLLGLLKDQILPEYPEAVVNIKNIKGLDYIRLDKDGLKIGALTKLNSIVASPVIKERFAVLAEAARSVATPEIRNMGTIGGNLAQEVRCWYYRYPDQLGGGIMCLRKGGVLCNAVAGDSRYHSIFGAAGMASRACVSQCPAHTAIPSYLSEIKAGHYMQAARVIVDFNPIPAITGRVCPGFCETQCKRAQHDAKVEVKCVERHLGDHMLEHRRQVYLPPETETGRSVAVIGSGPAGLSAAYYLRRAGHMVTVYDRLAEAGGMLFYGIPEFRLPKDVVKNQIEALRGMGINFNLNVDVGRNVSVRKLADSHDAVLVASGAWKEKAQGMKGGALAISGLEFLKSVNMGNRNKPGKKVAVIGGGNVALDVARTLVRLDAKPVVIYRRGPKEIPAFRDEVEKAHREGVIFRYLTLPTAASKNKGKIVLTCAKMRLGAPDASGRRRPVPKPGSEFVAAFDAVINAIGEGPDPAFLPSDLRKKAGKSARSHFLGLNLFMAGDFMSGPSSAINAIASGREAARLIDASLANRPAKRSKKAHAAGLHAAAPEVAGDAKVSDSSAPAPWKSMGSVDAPAVAADWAVREAERCLDCGCIAVNPSDIAVALVALDGRIVTTERSIGAAEFFAPDAVSATVLDADEIIKEIQIPLPARKPRQHYLKFTLRKPVDFAVVSVAGVFAERNGVCTDARIVLGAVAPAPFRARAAEDMLRGHPVNARIVGEAAEAALQGAQPLRKNEYKIPIARALIKRSILGEKVDGRL